VSSACDRQHCTLTSLLHEQSCKKILQHKEYDATDRMLLPSIVEEIEQEIGQSFTLDAFSLPDGSNAQCPKYCSLDQPFQQYNCQGHTVWMNPPFIPKLVQQALLHYKAQKRLAPHTTSACLLIPAFAKHRLDNLLKKWKLLKVLPKNKPVMLVPNQDGTRSLLAPGLPFDMAVYYDPPTPLQPATTAAIAVGEQISPLQAGQAEEDRLKFVVRGRLLHCRPTVVESIPVLIGLDTMASRNFISKSVAQAIGVKIKQHPSWVSPTVTLGDKSQTTSAGQAVAHFQVQGYKTNVTCEVLDALPGPFGLILGQQWLDRHRAILSYETLRCSFSYKRKKYSWQCGEPMDVDMPPPLVGVEDRPLLTPQLHMMLMTALQTKRLVKKQHCLDYTRCFWLMVQQVDDKLVLKDPDDPELVMFLDSQAKLFSEPPPGVPDHNQGQDDPEHAVDLVQGATPQSRPLFRLSRKEREELQRTINELLEKGYIKPSTSPFGAPILFVGKKDGTLRMCVDYRALNKLTIKNRYPLPRIDDLLDTLSCASHFTTLDLASGYHQIKVKEEDTHKTAFRTPLGLFEWLVMPFGLCNAPSTFQNAMDKVFGQRIGRFVLVYMDDILIYSRSREEHLQHLQEVFNLLSSHNYYLKRKKCDFMKTEVTFLGHVISKAGIHVDPSKLDVIRQWKRPEDKSEIRSLLGFGNYFRRFIFRYSEMVMPLIELTRENVPTIWTPQCEEAFINLKNAIINAPVLRHPDLNKPFQLVCDASLYASGAILMQEGHPIAFASKKFSPAEKNYSTEDRELLAIIQGLKLFRCYLEGSPCTLITDHNPLRYFDTKKELSPRQARWAHYLSRFDYKWEWIQGKLNPADFLSRNPAHAAMLMAVITRSATANPPPVTVQSFTEELGKLKQTRTRKKTTKKASPRKSKKKKKYQAQAIDLPQEWFQPSSEASATSVSDSSSFRMDVALVQLGYQRDTWFEKAENTKPLTLKKDLWWKGSALVIPDYLHLRTSLLKEFHEVKYSGHVGIHKTIQHLKRHYWWPKLNEDVKKWVRSCLHCQRNKADNKRPSGLMKPLPIPPRPWSSVSMDFITDLPETECGHDAICVFVDRLTKYVHFVPCEKTATALDVAQLFHNTIFKLHGRPDDIVSDRDPKFVSNLWKEVHRLMGTTLNMSSGYHAQTDGQTERMNRTLEDMLRHYVAPHQTDWIDHLANCEFAINNADQDSTGFSPFYLTYGYHPLTPGSSVVPSHVPAVAVRHKQMLVDLKNAKLNLEAAQKRQKYYYDTKKKPVEFDVGDQVLLTTKDVGLYCPGSPKLLPRWIGPFKVLARIGDLAYRLELPDVMKIHNVFHVSRLKKYVHASRVQPPPPPIPVDGVDEYEVEKVIDHRKVKSGRSYRDEYLVRWSGYGVEHDEWIPVKNFGDCMDPVKEYWKVR